MDRARRAQPSANPIITKQWDMHVARMHRRKLKQVKSRIDNKPPAVQKHLKNNAKRKQMKEERYKAIERENRILLQKMEGILRSNKIQEYTQQYKARSLNRAMRRKHLVKITEENQELLRRIQHSEPTYSHLDWEHDRRSQERVIARISQYDRDGTDKATRYVQSRARPRSATMRSRTRPVSAPVYKPMERRSARASARPQSAQIRQPRDAAPAHAGNSYGSYDSGTGDSYAYTGAYAGGYDTRGASRTSLQAPPPQQQQQQQQAGGSYRDYRDDPFLKYGAPGGGAAVDIAHAEDLPRAYFAATDAPVAAASGTSYSSSAAQGGGGGGGGGRPRPRSASRQRPQSAAPTRSGGAGGAAGAGHDATLPAVVAADDDELGIVQDDDDDEYGNDNDGWDDYN